MSRRVQLELLFLARGVGMGGVSFQNEGAFTPNPLDEAAHTMRTAPEIVHNQRLGAFAYHDAARGKNRRAEFRRFFHTSTAPHLWTIQSLEQSSAMSSMSPSKHCA